MNQFCKWNQLLFLGPLKVVVKIYWTHRQKNICKLNLNVRLAFSEQKNENTLRWFLKNFHRSVETEAREKILKL